MVGRIGFDVRGLEAGVEEEISKAREVLQESVEVPSPTNPIDSMGESVVIIVT